MKKEVLLFFLGLAAIPVARAQSIQPSVLNVAGGTATISGNTVDWSIGEMSTVATISNSGIIITQGFLQPEQSPTGIASQQFIIGHVQLYPNPADAFVIVQSDFPQAGNLKMSLTDVTGKILLHQETAVGSGIQKNEVQVSNLAAGNYFLLLSYDGNGNHSAATYKIQKIK